METISLARPTKPAIAALPLLLMLLVGSGYVASKVALGYVGPLTLILIQFAIATVILLFVALHSKAPWPTRRSQWAHLAVVGLLIQALQFIGLYNALDQGLSTGVSVLIIGLMPVFTVLGAAFFGESVSSKQWWSLWLGLFGVALAIAATVHTDGGGWLGYQAAAFGLIGITAGALYQRRFCVGVDLRTGGFIQLASAAAVVLPLAYAYEGMQMNPTPGLLFSSTWLALINSIGPIALFTILIGNDKANDVAGGFYLVPIITAVLGIVVLGESLSLVAIIGFAMTTGALYLCTRR